MTVQTKKDLPGDDELCRIFANSISQHPNRQDVLNETIHKDDSHLLLSIVCACIEQNIVFFINKTAANILIIYLQRRDKLSPVRDLKDLHEGNDNED